MWRIVSSYFWNDGIDGNDLRLVVIDDGRELDGHRIVIMMNLLTGDELEKWLQGALVAGWERVL